MVALFLSRRPRWFSQSRLLKSSDVVHNVNEQLTLLTAGVAPGAAQPPGEVVAAVAVAVTTKVVSGLPPLASLSMMPMANSSRLIQAKERQH